MLPSELIHKIMKRYLITTCLLLSFWLSSQKSNPSSDLFNKGNEFYQKSDYQTAINSYLTIINHYNKQSAELYFNLANCYYKTNEVGLSIYYYEKARLLNPNLYGLDTNLMYARKKAIESIGQNNIEIEPIETIKSNFFNIFSKNKWAILSCIFSVLIALSFFIYRYNNRSIIKRLFFTLIFIAIIGFSISLIAIYTNENRINSINTAIVITKEIQVKTEPVTSSSVEFSLHQGAKVFITEKMDDWFKITISNQSKGWVHSNDIKLLNPDFKLR